MHGPALARSQWRTVGAGRTRTRALENRLAWHWTSRSRTHRGSRGRPRYARRCGRSQRRLIHRTRPSLRNDHSWQRHRRRWWCARGSRSGRHGWHLWDGGCGSRDRCDGRCQSNGGPRGHYRWNCRPGHRRSYRSRGLRRSGRRWNRKGWPRGRSGYDKFRRCRRRSNGRLWGGNGRCWRCWRDGRLGRNGRRSRRSIHNCGSLLLADDGF